MADPAAGPGDLGKLAGLNSRPDLNGCRVEVQGTVPGADGLPRLAVRVLFGACAGSVLKVKAANLELDARGTGPAVDELEREMRALATTPALAAAAAGVAEEDWRDWGGRFGNELPEEVLVKIAEKVVALQEAECAAHLTSDGCDDRKRRRKMKERAREGTCCLYIFARVCKPWRKAQLKAQVQVGGPLLTRACSYVIDPGRVELAKWALAEGCPRRHSNGINMAHAAAYRGHLELVQWLVRVEGFEMDEMVVSRAARSGNLELVKWLQAMGCGYSFWSTETCKMAAQGGALEVLTWLHLNKCPWEPAEVCKYAALRGNLEMLRWARENGCDWENWDPSEAGEVCSAAGQRGQLEVLQWLRETGCWWDKMTCQLAARDGHLETLRWAIENGCDWRDPDLCCAAAHSGKLEILQWLRSIGCPWNKRTCSSAALEGHMETLRWARAQGCDWDASTPINAAWAGELEILQWSMVEGCPINEGAGQHAAEQGHVEVLRWLRERGCPWTAATRDLAAEKLGYTDDFGNLGYTDEFGNFNLLTEDRAPLSAEMKRIRGLL